MRYEVQVAQLQARPAAVVRSHVSPGQLPEFLGKAFADVAQALAHQGLAPAGPPFGRYVPTGDGAFEVVAGFPTPRPAVAEGRVEPDELPGGEAAITMHRGRYEDVGAAYSATQAWLVDNGYLPTGPAWEVYLDDPQVVEPRTEVFQPCQAARH